MHRVIAGCNLWAILFLAAAFALGAAHSPWHVRAGIFAAVFALLAQSAIFALFMGASKLLQEHVARYRMGEDLIERTNGIMLPLFGWASATSGVLLVFAILAGLGASGELPVLVHVVVGGIATVVLALAVMREVPAMAAMHQVLLDMESALPEPPAADSTASHEPPPDPNAPSAPDLRRRALFYVGSTVLAMLAGYRYISGIRIPQLVTTIALSFAVLCLLLWGLLAIVPERAPRP